MPIIHWARSLFTAMLLIISRQHENQHSFCQGFYQDQPFFPGRILIWNECSVLLKPFLIIVVVNGLNPLPEYSTKLAFYEKVL